MFEHYLGKPRHQLRGDGFVRYAMNCQGFAYWFENKFLKWEYDITDSDDLKALQESLISATDELGYMDNAEAK